MKRFHLICTEGPFEDQQRKTYPATLVSSTGTIDLMLGLQFIDGKPEIDLEINSNDYESYRKLQSVIDSKEIENYQFEVHSQLDEKWTLKAFKCISTDYISMSRIISSAKGESIKIGVIFVCLTFKTNLKEYEVDNLEIPYNCAAYVLLDTRIPRLEVKSKDSEVKLESYAFKSDRPITYAIVMASSDEVTDVTQVDLTDSINQALGMLNFATETYHPVWLKTNLYKGKLELEYYSVSGAKRSPTPVVHPQRMKKFLEEAWLKIIESGALFEELHVPISWHCDFSANYQNKLIHCVTALEYLINSILTSEDKKSLTDEKKAAVKASMKLFKNDLKTILEQNEIESLFSKMSHLYEKTLFEKITLLLDRLSINIDENQDAKLREAIRIRNDITHRAVVQNDLADKFWNSYQFMRMILCKVIFSKIGLNYEPEKYY